MTTIATFPSLALCVLVASPAWAQDQKTPPPAPDQAPVIAHETPRAPAAAGAVTRPRPTHLPPLALPGVLWSERDDVLWVRTPNYKACFDGPSFTFVPFLGADAPENEPVEFTLGAVSVAGRALVTSRPAARREGDRVELDRGALVERYDVSEGGVEQSFRFDSLPERGAIELDLAVDTALEHGADADGHVFACERGAVRYGVATAVDARGRKALLETTWAGNALHIAVPAAFVAEATLPLVVDPFVFNMSIEQGTWDAIRPDLAFDASTSKWAAVFEVAFSASDHDVFLQSFWDAGPMDYTATIDASSTSWETARVANCAAGSQYLVVAAVGLAPTRTIHAVRVDAWSFATLADVRVDTAAGDKLDPDVGGDPSNGLTGTYAVVWTRVYSATDRDVHGRFVYTDGTMSGASEMLLDNSAGTLDERPRISNSCGTGASAQWSIVFQRAITSTNHDVLGLGLARNGTIVYPTFAIANGPEDTTSPAISPATEPVNGASFRLCVYEQSVPNLQHDILGRFLNGNVAVATYALMEDARDEIAPDVDTNGRVFGVACERERTLGVQDYGTAYSTIAYVPNSACTTESTFPAGSTSSVERYPRVYAKHSAGSTSQRIGLVYDRRFSSIDHDVEFSLFDPDRTPAPVPFCFGDASTCPCGNAGTTGHGCANSVDPAGALLSATGDSTVSLDSLVLQVTGVPATSSCLFFQGDAQTPATPFGDGSLCAGGTVVRLRTKAASGGVASFPGVGDPSLSVRGQLPPEGGLRVYQVWYRNAASFCTPATFNASNGVMAWWMP